MAINLVWLAAAGAVGTLARFGLGAAVQRYAPANFPWATLVVNLLGCFLYGAVWTMAEHRGLINAQWRLILLTGFMGSFTTFSSYAFETALLAQQKETLTALANVIAENGVGILALFAGLAIGKAL